MTYLSYPALYTHNRNKHNIIPITKKQEIFKKVENSNTNGKKFKYSAFNESTNLQKLSTNVMNVMSIVLKDYYLNPQSPLFNINFKIDNYALFFYLNKYKTNNLKKVFIPNRTENASIDLTLITYLLLLIEVSIDTNFIKNVIKFIVLLREYLNLCGWDHKQYLLEYGMSDPFIVIGEFCSRNTAEEIPELLNDFIEVFLNMDKQNFFDIDKKNLGDLTLNFANWMFLNEMTNFKIFSVYDKIKQ